MQNQPQCYIDTDGRVACDTGGHMQNPAATLVASPVEASVAPPSSTAAPQSPQASGFVTARPVQPPACCVHIQTEDLTGVSASSPRAGRLDCPDSPEYHEKDVTVIAVEPDGNNGMIATVLLKAYRGPGASASASSSFSAANPIASAVAARTQDVCFDLDRGMIIGGRYHGVQPHPGGWNLLPDGESVFIDIGGDNNATIPVCPTPPVKFPVCTVGPQDDEPVPCCLVDSGRAGGAPVVECEDPSHPLHGLSADSDIVKRHTLQLCPPPPDIPPCCVELGNFDGKNARLVCEDEAHVAHHKPLDVEVSPDGMTAAIKVGDYSVEVPVCETTDVPEEVPCCVRDGLLFCPDAPQYHGRPYEEVMSTGVQLLPCEDIPPPTNVPQDCCVRLEGGTAVFVCSDTSSPWHGYELNPNEFQCDEASGQCSVALQVPGQSNLFTAVFPLCPPGVEDVPPDCCYDVATGTLVCTDTASEWHGLKVSLINMQGGSVMVAHPKFGSAPVQFPICEVPVPEDCCFEPAAEPVEGATGVLRCTSGELDGRDAVLTDYNTMPDGSVIVTVSFLGGSARMPLCAQPPEDCPDCPPPYFCCVNLDTGTFVCPANKARHGQPANVANVVDVGGAPWAVLTDGQRVPGCGSGCPSPEPCKPPGLVPQPDPGCEPETGIPQTPPSIPGPQPGTPPPCPQTSTGVPQTPPSMPGPQPGTPPPCPEQGSGVPQNPPSMPGPQPGTPPPCPQQSSGVPQGPPSMPGPQPGTPPPCAQEGSGVPQGPPSMPGPQPGTPPPCPPGGIPTPGSFL